MYDDYEVEVTYTLLEHMRKVLTVEVEGMNQDCLVDECLDFLGHLGIGEDYETIGALSEKHLDSEELTESEMNYLRSTYVLFHLSVAFVVDEPEDDDELN